MERMRDVLKHSLGRSLAALPELDRLAAAWPIACGKATAAHGRVIAFAGGAVTILVEDPGWLDQMVSLRGTLVHDLARIAEVEVVAIHFESTGRRPRQPAQGTPR